ncbi:high affinity cGMP-specific 3',5'-cyclic phosphodiesterase 9A isoform X1 [Episyrphus balteatus]|uniref:high affinity cGMP-specific 3',5'-cyclic phosphodiesterase 9A isoform X1 n=1 Tax=Episyrphus balteatus TaxID=286459 RepID=UPI0024857BEC|nr:high affinity cGMP-specific 3',5'-cyclic phosphodiesterase 9A isoform X1 [Episyrphus balteatus]XP_055854235.1 high affinity cGMP-specific 3',5'-cyclic phosphodiesterase 9A isoform X1 [Episyrphus balteatus]XP_055854236.1 high affinity cGMP-specific 3',5'-cyclic phosphodiesterase 9A isoform X1 [Episyrphus balteatus]XP_055854237.1 high affinity cGMP-specific 3',5'-cyclic phosphodiesterase 9A isoform X1 [Episyrphus balteatus]XP_055854238.1 high affinity cGMP-specific 3',5'-cyclic phosphodiestera
MYKDNCKSPSIPNDDSDDDSSTAVCTDVQLIRKIGYIASRVRYLSEIYANFKLTNPYSDLASVPSYSSAESLGSTATTTTVDAHHSQEQDLNQALDSADARLRQRILENLLVQIYEDHQTVTVIRETRGNSSKDHCFYIMNSNSTTSSSVERLLQANDDEDESNDNTLRKNFLNVTTTTTGSSQREGGGRGTTMVSFAASTGRRGSDNALIDCRRRGSGSEAMDQLKVNNCQQLMPTSSKPVHRGSCGATGEHLLAANSIAKKSTIILSKSCSNVDAGGGTGNGCASLYPKQGPLNGEGANVAALADSTGGSVVGGSAGNNGNSEFSVVQMNNTIIQCHFSDDDFRALVKDLKRKVEYTERTNWLCKLTHKEMHSLSKRPMGPPHRKSSLPKHTEVKKRFLEICDTTFSDEVKAALRLPSFDSYDWSDSDVIHLMQTMFIELGFTHKFHIPMDTLREWLYEVYKHYNEVPFHNFRHCFCVAQMMYAITRQANLISRLGELECLILLVSCICHDLDHPGYNNIYQINARTELALRYNDISPLENHHCSIAFRLLEHPECNIFKHFSRESFNVIREGIIRCILATDMARHNEILDQFKEVTPTFDYSNRSHVNLLCMILIKVADISNEARPMDVAEPWLDRLLQEFFAQSAAEKSEGLPVTPFMDPDKVSKPGSQVRFIGLVLLPLFEALGDLVPELTELIIIPVRNALDYYKHLNDAQNKSRKSLAEAAENTSSDGGGVSPQLPRSQSGISVKSRRSIPSQKSASRNSVDEPTCIAAELHDLPEGSESGDSETATEVDVAEKTSKFKVDTEGSSNRSKSSHSNSRKSSREKRPSMIGEMCSTGGNRIRNSYGNIHGYHTNRCHFSSNRAVSLDQYSCNNRRLSDGLQQVISDSNVFYNRQNRGSVDTSDSTSHHLSSCIERPKISEGSGELSDVDVLNMNTPQGPHINVTSSTALLSATNVTSSLTSTAPSIDSPVNNRNLNSNGNYSQSNGLNAGGNKSWKARFKQISDYFSFSFDKGNKRFGSTRSSPCSVRNNNASDLSKPGAGICCTISNNLSPSFKHKQHELISAGRNRAYSLDVPTRNRYSSSSGGDSRKSSRNEDNSNRGHDLLNEDNNSNNTISGEMAPPPIRIGSVDASESIIITSTALPRVITPNLGDVQLMYSGSIGSGNVGEHSIDLSIPSGSRDPPKI